jgi:biotin transport system ATP-binding protein
MDENPSLFSVRSLVKKFPNGFEALRGIDLDIVSGECLLIAGANGSGKTLLMHILAGLTAPSGGEVLFKGRPLSSWGSLLHRHVGIVFQDAGAQIIGETVEEDIRFGPENLKLPGEEISERLERCLGALDLKEKRDFPPRRLSGGEKRRLAAAGVLAMGCGTVIMDEPFANLDWPGVVQVLTIIERLKAEGKTVILLTHELEKVLAFAGRLVILAGGKIRDQGKPEEVLDRLEEAWGVRDPRRDYRNAGDCSWR